LPQSEMKLGKAGVKPGETPAQKKLKRGQ